MILVPDSIRRLFRTELHSNLLINHEHRAVPSRVAFVCATGAGLHIVTESEECNV